MSLFRTTKDRDESKDDFTSEPPWWAGIVAFGLIFLYQAWKAADRQRRSDAGTTASLTEESS